MNVRTPQLSLDELMVEAGREPVSSLAHEWLKELAHRPAISDELIESRTCFTPNMYARNLVCRTPAFELFVLCRRPGHGSTIHDHAGSLNSIGVHRGELTSRVFVPAAGRLAGTGPVELLAEERVRPGGSTGLDRGGIHQHTGD